MLVYQRVHIEMNNIKAKQLGRRIGQTKNKLILYVVQRLIHFQLSFPRTSEHREFIYLYMEVSWNVGTPKSSIYNRIIHIVGVPPVYGNPHIITYIIRLLSHCPILSHWQPFIDDFPLLNIYIYNIYIPLIWNKAIVGKFPLLAMIVLKKTENPFISHL